MTSRFGRTLTALALPLLATSSLAQDFNNLDLTNGGDGLFFYNDPSIGAPLGTVPPDLDGDFWWKVYPKEVMNHPLGTLEMTGLTIELYDTDWINTPADVSFDTVFTPGVVSTLNPGNIEPDFNHALGFTLLGVASFGGQLTNPCSDPAFAANFCTALNGCPAGGGVVGYIIGLTVLDPVTNEGIDLQADGATDWTYSTFVPGGMLGPISGGGACGTGDYLFQDVHSSNVFPPNTNGELQSDVLLTGFSKYGGAHGGGSGLGVYFPDALDEVFAGPLEFAEPISESRNDVGLGPQLGLASLNPSQASGPIGMRLWSQSNINELGFFFASFFPLFPAPGIPIFDINIMVNISDPLAGTISGLWNGLIAGGQGDFQDDGVLDTILLQLPPITVGFTLNVQGFAFDPVTSDFDNTQCVSLPIQP
jgi:hypothetical protein